MKRRPPTLEGLREYLLDRCSPEPFTGCWLWTGYVNVFGYGRVVNGYYGKGISLTSNRAAAEAWLGFDALNDKRHVCHKCDVPSCINPEHLFIGTHQDNMADAFRKGRMRINSVANKKKTHCKRGHPFDSENTAFRLKGHRTCRKCNVIKTIAYRERKRLRAS